MNLGIVQERVLMDKNPHEFVQVGDEIVDWLENEFAKKKREIRLQSKMKKTNHRLQIKTCFSIMSSLSL